MEEAVVGATIQVLLQNLLSIAAEEVGLIRNFNKDLRKLKESVVLIRDFLDDAEMKQVKEKPIKRWLMKLEAVAYDADYIFDELNYHVLRKKVQRDNKTKKKVRRFLPNFKSFAFRHKMAKKIKDIKDELKSIYDVGSQLGLMARIASVPARGAGTEAPAYLETDSFSVDPVFVGRENEVREMAEMLTSSQTEEVISVLPIVGMGGLGKTTLARKVYNYDKIISHFGERIWVHVPQNFDPLIVLKKTFESLTGEYVDRSSKEVVLSKLREKIEDKRYLLVLDNVWNEETEKWEDFINSLEGISHVKGNVILVTTRKSNVVTIVKTLDAHELGSLSVEDCWFIIKAKAFGGKGIPSEFETIGKNIAKKCGSLPLAAQAVGSLLRGKSKDEWVSIEKNWLSNFGRDENRVSKILKFSYDNLSSQSLKKCFAFCAIIPKGWSIEPDNLIALWMAEGCLQTHQKEDMEIAGKKVVNLLVQSSLLHVAKRDAYRNIVSCDMHDLVHDLARSVLNPKFQENNYQVRYISERSIDESSPIMEEQAKCLRALFLSGELSHTMLSNLKCLHVLILNNEDVKELPIEIGRLISLRYIDIAFTRIECLPDSFGDLYHLQTLIATKEYGGESYLRELPDTFKCLISLRHLYIPNIKLPRGIGKLVSLRSLPYFQVGNEEGFGIMELGRLTNLRGEIEIHNLEKVGDKEEAKSADLFHKPNILKLKLVWNESVEDEGRINDENVLEGLQPHPNLKRLEINGFKGTSFPLWTLRMKVREDLESSRWVRLDNLLEIKLSGCEKCVEIPMLGHLPNLKSLYLHDLSNVKSMGSSFYGIEENAAYKEKAVVFPALENLELIGMPNLIAWDEVELPRSFCCLKYLKISDCRQLKSAPSDFPCLKELEIINMESELPLANICGSKITSLTKLIIRKVDGLERLPNGLFYNNRDLLELEIEKCNNLTHLVPCLGGGGASLRKLAISFCRNFKELPEDLHILNALEELQIRFCPNLKSIAYYPSGGGGQLSSQGGFTSLRKLDIGYCKSVTNLPIPMIESCASSLERLWLGGSKSITNLPHVMSILPKMPRLISLSIQNVPKLSDVAAEIGRLHSLGGLSIGGSSDCRNYVSFKDSLGLIFPKLQSLNHLSLCGMKQWDALPDQVQQLTTLQYLHLHEFGIEALPEWLASLSSLILLGLYKCQKIRRFPSKKVMQGLTKLNDIVITNCPLLKQNLENEAAAAASDDSEWSKISHIPTIKLDRQPFSAPH